MGLRYAFPNAMARLERKLPRLIARRERVARVMAAGDDHLALGRHLRESVRMGTVCV